MKREIFDPLCHELMFHYCEVTFTDGSIAKGYIMAKDNDPVQADLGRFAIGVLKHKHFENYEPIRLYASQVKKIIRKD